MQTSPDRDIQGQQEQRTRIPHWVRPLILDLGCCGTSALQIGAPEYGLPGLNGGNYDLEPDHANVLIVAGRVPDAFSASLRALYERVASPRWVIAYGTCAVSGAVFGTMATERVVPVDVCVPGCPPHPTSLCNALARLSRRRQS